MAEQYGISCKIYLFPISPGLPQRILKLFELRNRNLQTPNEEVLVADPRLSYKSLEGGGGALRSSRRTAGGLVVRSIPQGKGPPAKSF